MSKPLDEIPRTLNKSNIDQTIVDYLKLLEEIPIYISTNNVLELFTKFKRETVNVGPYPYVTLFEASNRIMTDLTIFFAVKKLLTNEHPFQFNFDSYTVDLGNESNLPHDINASNEKQKLAGEAFNVAASFFQGKKGKTLGKLRDNTSDNDIVLLVYNTDAIKETYKPKLKDNEFHLPVQIDWNLVSNANI